MGWLDKWFGKKKEIKPTTPTFAQQAAQAAKRIAEETAEDVAARILLNTPLSQEEQFLELTDWHEVQSSNVRAISYNKQNSEIHIEYRDGSFYGYGPVSWDQARSLFNASSKGKWVWDHLRKRGTSQGYQVQYWFLSGPSRTRHGGINDMGGKESIRNWMGTPASRKAHGDIGPGG